MHKHEALRIARKTIADAFQLEFAAADDCILAIPAERHPNGLAKNKAHQEAADAYNLLAKMAGEIKD